jgi:hypothetical protein
VPTPPPPATAVRPAAAGGVGTGAGSIAQPSAVRGPPPAAIRVRPTQLGIAAYVSSLAPEAALEPGASLLQAYQHGLVLDDDLGVLFYLTPPEMRLMSRDGWAPLADRWDTLSSACPRLREVAEQLGLAPQFIAQQRNRGAAFANDAHPQYARFFCALILRDLLGDATPGRVAHAWRQDHGWVQSLQTSAATFAGMVCSFVRALNLERLLAVVSLFRDRLDFGVKPELMPLLRVRGVTAARARALYVRGFRSPAALAAAEPDAVAGALQAFAQHDRGGHRDAVAHLRDTADRLARELVTAAQRLVSGRDGGGAGGDSGSDSEEHSDSDL